MPPAPRFCSDPPLEGWPDAWIPGRLHRRPPRPGFPELFALALPDPPGDWIAALEAGASPARRARAGRFRRPMDALRCLAAEALLWTAARAVHGLAPDQLETGAGPQGKPFFLRHPHLQFNLSHAGPWVLCALDTGPVGVDVEQEAAIPPQAARAILGPAEWPAFLACPGAERRAALCCLWTAKESLLKAAGIGIGWDPRRIACDSGLQPAAGAPPAPAGCRWHLEHLPLPGGATAALCWAR